MYPNTRCQGLAAGRISKRVATSKAAFSFLTDLDDHDLLQPNRVFTGQAAGIPLTFARCSVIHDVPDDK